MFESRIDSPSACAERVAGELKPIYSMIAKLRQFAVAEGDYFAVQNDQLIDEAYPLAAYYAHANSITRRRFDAILREAGTIGSAGLKMLLARTGRPDRGTLVAARFLGNSLGRHISQLEELFAIRAA